MARDALNRQNPPPGGEDWPALFRRQVANNARYWAQQIAGRPADTPMLHQERDNIVKALGRALQLDAAWDPAADLLLVFHQYMERQGPLPTGSTLWKLAWRSASTTATWPPRQPCTIAWAS